MGLFSSFFRRNDRRPAYMDDPAWKAAAGQGTAAWEEEEELISYDEADDPDLSVAGMRVGLVYVDANRRTTTRIIRIKGVWGDHGAISVRAFCELRQDVRTFNASQMRTLFDPATGEVLMPPEEFFGVHIDEREARNQLRFEQSRFRQIWPVIELLRAELQVLILVARADGRFVKSEQEAMLRFAAARAHDLGVPVADAHLVTLRDWIRLQDPSEPEAREAIRSLAASGDGLASIWEVSELIAEADGKIKPEERAAVAEIRSTIEAVASGRA